MRKKNKRSGKVGERGRERDKKRGEKEGGIEERE